MNSDVLSRIEDMGACRTAVTWLRSQPSLEEAWRTCSMPDWMMWWAARSGAPREEVLKAALTLLRPALSELPPDHREEASRLLDRLEAEGCSDRLTRSAEDLERRLVNDRTMKCSARWVVRAISYAVEIPEFPKYADTAAAFSVRSHEEAMTEAADGLRAVWPDLPGEFAT